MPIYLCRKRCVLVQRKSVRNVQERHVIYTGFVKVDIENSNNVKFILKLQNVFKEMRAVNAYEIGSDRRMFEKDAHCLET